MSLATGVSLFLRNFKPMCCYVTLKKTLSSMVSIHLTPLNFLCSPPLLRAVFPFCFFRTTALNEEKLEFKKLCTETIKLPCF